MTDVVDNSPDAGRGGIAPTADYIAHFAGLRPSDTAIVEEGRRITFAQFHEDLCRFHTGFQELKLKPGDRAAVEWTSLYEHWLCLLALEKLGVATFSYTRQEVPTYWPFLKEVDLVICSKEAVPKDCARVLALTDEQRAALFALSATYDPADTLLDPETIVRIQCTSGTTGEAKRMLRSARVNDCRIRQYQDKEGYTRYSRYFLTHPFSVQAVYGRATACLRMGGACIGVSGDAFRSIKEHGVTHLAVLPAMLEKLQAMRPASFDKPKRLIVSTFGARLSDTLRRRVLQGLATELIESYGANEVGSICTIGPDGSGVVVPGVTVETVDADGQPVVGVEGEVRIRSAGMVDGYDDNPAATARLFRNGWFYPGDRAVLSHTHRLTLRGRTDDLVNVGGFKVDCAALEEKLRETVTAPDLCVTTVPMEGGEERLCIVFVLAQDATLDGMKAEIAPAMPPNLGEIVMVRLDEIPRGEAGKVRRDALLERIRQRS